MGSSGKWTDSGFYANLTNGVSQQPERVRLDSQLDEASNMYPTTFHQAGHRPPLEIVSELADLESSLDIATNGYPHRHGYVRDADEAYEIFFDGAGGIFVYDRDTGVEQTVNLNVSDGYLTHSSPETGFHCLTYKDVTFVVNRSITVAMESTLSTTRTPEALVYVKDWVSGATYSVTVKAGATTITVTPTGTDVNDVASDIRGDLIAHGSWGGTGLSATVYGNAVHISGANLTSVNVSDNRAGTAIRSFKDTVVKVGDLPPFAPHGYLVKVTGSSSTATAQDANEADDQYYRFVSSGGSGGSGTWTETVAPGIKYIIDPDTAPHTLTRNSSGEFDWDVIDWGTRDVGDETTNPNPIFIGQTIRSTFLLGNRLGFLAGGQFAMSRVGEESYYEFFRSTTSAQLDDDPVFGVVPSNQVPTLYHAVAWNGELVLFGDLVDGVVSYGNKLALSNLNITTPTNSGVSPTAAPFLSGSDLLFVSESGEYSNIGSYEIDAVTSIRSAESITEDYLGSYVPRGIKRVVGRNRGFVAFLSTEARQRVYVLTYSKKAGRLVQQAVVYWDFSNVPDMDILDVAVDGSWLYLTYGGPDGKFYVGRLDTSAGAADTNFPHKCYLDHRMVDTGTYDAMTDTTTFTLPYALTAGDKRIVVRSVGEDETRWAVGENLTIASSTDTTVVVSGDLSDADISVFVGYGMSRYFVPNPVYKKTQNIRSGNLVTDMLKEVNLSRIAVGFFKTQYLKVELISKLTGRILSSREFIGGLQLDNVYATLDDNETTYTGKLLIDGINASVGDTYLKISSDSHLPFFVDMIQWVDSEYDANV